MRLALLARDGATLFTRVVIRGVLTSPQGLSTADPAASRRMRTAVWVMLGAALYLAANLFADPATPYLLGGDQMFFWLDGMRLLSGQHIYRDFLQFTPPGTDLVFWSLFRVLGLRIWVTNLVVLLLGLALCGLSFRLGSRIMPPSRAALATALIIVVVYGKWLDATHHWFSALAVLGALAVLMSSRSAARIAAAGVLLGVATFFTQTRGPAAALALAAVLSWERSLTGQPWGEQGEQLQRHAVPLGLLFGTMCVSWLALSSYYILTVGPALLWNDEVAFVHQYMLGSKALTHTPDEGSAWNALSLESTALLTFYLLPVVYALSLWIAARGAQTPPSEQALERSRVLLLAATGGAMLLEMVFSPNILRASCVAAPGMILLVWLLGRGRGTVMRHAPAILWAGVLAVAGHQIASRHLQHTAVMQLPAGRAAVRDLPAEKLAWLAAHTHPGEAVFDAAWLAPYLPLGLRNPLFLDDVGGYMFRDSEDAAAAPLDLVARQRLSDYVRHLAQQLLAEHVQYVVWQPRLAVPPFRVPVLQAFLAEHYIKTWTFSDLDEVWELKDTARSRQASRALGTQMRTPRASQ